MPAPLAGQRLGTYAVGPLLGAGGMGEVYRAHDTKLGRDVAIKIVSGDWLADASRRARFDREARVLASLNHPSIGAIYGFEDRDGIRALVLELVEGPTLADRCARGPVALVEALDIARQIAAALEAAHERGMIHRDLKPANIKVTPDGRVKVLDFGLAKALDDEEEMTNLTEAPTVTVDRTRDGVLLGTAAYMSPEQARGLAVDRRTDVWAFGCVLYELLTGHRAFDGPTRTDILAAVIDREPDWTRLPSSTPGGIRRVLSRCLQKDPGQRLRDIGDVRILIDDALSLQTEQRTPFGRRRWWVWAAGVLALSTIAALVVYLRPGPTPGDMLRLSVSAPGPIAPQLSGAISPDGHQLAFVAPGASGKAMLWVRPLDSPDAREIPGTERAAHPFWSPDAHAIAFIADGKLKRISSEGGPTQILADSTNTYRVGGAWSRDGVVLFSPSPDRLAAVPASGGPIRTVLTADPSKKQFMLVWPDFLPDGRHFLYYAQSELAEFRGVYIGSLDSTETAQLLKADIQAKYAEPGYLLFLRDEILMAQPFDAWRRALSGEPAAIADGVWFARGASHSSFSVSRTGVLAYVNASQWDRQLAWFDRTGRSLGAAAAPARTANGMPQISPDDRRIAVALGEWGRGDLWIQEPSRGTSSRITFSPNEWEGVPFWSADGHRLLYQAGARVIVKNLDTGAEDFVIDWEPGGLWDWSRDGRFLILSRGPELWAADVSGDRRPFPFLQSRANNQQAQLSPDGRWLAYTSNESGRDEVYVQRFPAPGSKRQISADGGAMPRWRRDGRELFYLAANQVITAVPVSGDRVFEPGSPVPLFRTRLIVWGSEGTGLPILPTSYDVSADGQRFLINGPPEDPLPPMTVVYNWLGALKK